MYSPTPWFFRHPARPGAEDASKLPSLVQGHRITRAARPTFLRPGQEFEGRPNFNLPVQP